jgi:hypothetical protein
MKIALAAALTLCLAVPFSAAAHEGCDKGLQA